MIVILALVAVASDLQVVRPARLLPGFTVSEADYPPSALRQEASGVVGFAVTVDPDGAPSQCVVTRSLSPAIDEKTCAIVIARMRFAPARNAAGAAITTVYRRHIRWNIEGDPAPFAAGTAAIGWYIVGGKLGECRARIDGFDRSDLLRCEDLSPEIVTALVGAPLANYSGVEMRVALRTDPAYVSPAILTDGSRLKNAVSAHFTLTASGDVDTCTVSDPQGLAQTAVPLCAILRNKNIVFPASSAPAMRSGVFGFYIYARPVPSSAGASHP